MRQGEDPLFHGAPAVLLFHAPPRETSEADCALAAGQVTLLAPSLGLGTCHIGYASAVLRRFGRLARTFGVPADRRVYAVVALGHPAVLYPRLVPRPPIPTTRA
jgi:nitroreductase